MKPTELATTNLTDLKATGEVKEVVENNFRRLVEHARQQWEGRFSGKDPSDACVSVRIVAVDTVIERKAVRGSGFVKSTKKFEQRANISLPRYAQ